MKIKKIFIFLLFTTILISSLFGSEEKIESKNTSFEFVKLKRKYIRNSHINWYPVDEAGLQNYGYYQYEKTSQQAAGGHGNTTVYLMNRASYRDIIIDKTVSPLNNAVESWKVLDMALLYITGIRFAALMAGSFSLSAFSFMLGGIIEYFYQTDQEFAAKMGNKEYPPGTYIGTVGGLLGGIFIVCGIILAVVMSKRFYKSQEITREILEQLNKTANISSIQKKVRIKFCLELH